MINLNNVIDNRACCINKELFTSKLQSAYTKLRLYNPVIKAIGTYACET